ncbi:hypothetical protein [Marasmitruncus massiliensis]|uniref:hypothetical protein n=1 Tax=Marasmitruncus massiliensis TaxID=1944642 RepID=UPI000C7C4FCF|nr:hypothetical protein [Marasmitruncus massiliensis]
MELVIKRKNCFFEGISSMLRKKGDNVVYEEEKVYGGRLTGDVKTEFTRMLEDVDAKSHTLIITDPYFLSCNTPDIIDFFLSTIIGIAPKEICVLCPQKNICPSTLHFFTSILKDKGICLIQRNCSAFHDRFWIIKESGRGFILGTSLNGILGKRIFYVNAIDDADVSDIFAFLTSENLI